MLTTRKKYSRNPWRKLYVKKAMQKVSLFQFPAVKGLEEISQKLNTVKAENLFVALLHAFTLQPLDHETKAHDAERMLEYLNRAFEKEMPSEVQHYYHILSLLIEEYDHKHTTRAAEGIPPHLFLKALLEEDNVLQKSLVPDCFRSESQVSEFLRQKKGRLSLSYEQAVRLGHRFHVDPLNFL